MYPVIEWLPVQGVFLPFLQWPVAPARLQTGPNGIYYRMRGHQSVTWWQEMHSLLKFILSEAWITAPVRFEVFEMSLKTTNPSWQSSHDRYILSTALQAELVFCQPIDRMCQNEADNDGKTHESPSIYGLCLAFVWNCELNHVISEPQMASVLNQLM